MQCVLVLHTTDASNMSEIRITVYWNDPDLSELLLNTNVFTLIGT